MVIFYFHDRDVGITRRFISLPRCREVGYIQRLYIISTAVMSRLPKGVLVCHGVVRFVPSNGYIYCFHSRDVGFTGRFISCHGVVRLVSSNGYILFPRL